MGGALLSAFAVSLVCVCVCERVIHSGVSLFVPSLRGKHERAAHVVSSAVQVGVSGVFSVALAPLRVALGWVRTMVWVVGAMCVLAAVNVAWEEYPEAVVKATGYYNARVGPFAHAYLFFPLELGNALFKGVAPVYNGAIWVWRGLIQQGLLPALWDTFPLLMDMAVGVLRLGQQCTASVTVFAKGLGCEGQACLTGSVDLDLMSPMATVRDLAILSSRLAGSVCSGLAVPLDLVLYPLMDLNMAGAVHGLGNAALHALVHLPLVTYERCSRHGGAGAGMDVLMCTPDFEPAVVQLVSGLRSAGSLLDNWMNIGGGSGAPDGDRGRCGVLGPRGAGPGRIPAGGADRGADDGGADGLADGGDQRVDRAVLRGPQLGPGAAQVGRGDRRADGGGGGGVRGRGRFGVIEPDAGAAAAVAVDDDADGVPVPRRGRGRDPGGVPLPADVRGAVRGGEPGGGVVRGPDVGGGVPVRGGGDLGAERAVARAADGGAARGVRVGEPPPDGLRDEGDVRERGRDDLAGAAVRPASR
jgi:hypothetical protein